MRSPALARAALSVLCAYSLFIGFTALVVPHTFYTDFPFVAHWVERLPPYNEHLVTDVGGLYVGYAVITGIAAWRPERLLVIAACAGFLAFSVPHLLFHATHLDGFGAVDGAFEIAGLASLLVPPGLALWAVRSPAEI
ncbi:MAG: hypothetical protein JST53_10740 [Actinobacteria bacterium]|nr:hypothetical protein [Actinomycetota bacterium]